MVFCATLVTLKGVFITSFSPSRPTEPLALTISPGILSREPSTTISSRLPCTTFSALALITKPTLAIAHSTDITSAFLFFIILIHLIKNLFFNLRHRAVRVSRATPAKSIFYQGRCIFRQEKTPFCTTTERRTCPLPFSCHSQHTLVFTFSGNSSGSVSSQVLPSQFPSAGFAPAYLLSLSTPDRSIIFICSLLQSTFSRRIIA